MIISLTYYTATIPIDFINTFTYSFNSVHYAYAVRVFCIGKMCNCSENQINENCYVIHLLLCFQVQSILKFFVASQFKKEKKCRFQLSDPLPLFGVWSVALQKNSKYRPMINNAWVIRCIFPYGIQGSCNLNWCFLYIMPYLNDNNGRRTVRKFDRALGDWTPSILDGKWVATSAKMLR